MDNEKMARFIAEQRKLKKMTQKELAERLGITDKAVSKWERGLSCPDIALLTELSEALEISVSDLLSGAKADSLEDNSVENVIEMMVETTLQYADKVTRDRSKDIRALFIAAISALSFLGITICMICDLAITGSLTWSLYPVSALVYTWLITTPAIIYSRKGAVISLLCISLFTIPFLYVLEIIIGRNGLIMPLATPVFILSVIYLWIAYFIIAKTKWPKYISAATAVFVGIPVSVGINFIIARRIGEPIIDVWDLLAYAILFVLSALIYGYGYIKDKCIG